MNKKLSSTPLVAVAVFSLAACGSDSTDSSTDTSAAAGDTTAEAVSGEVTVTEAWVRQPADGQTVAAGYGIITNGTDEAITLVGASVPVSATIEIHETTVGDDGTMSMSEKEGGFTVEPGTSFTLEPGGPHVMMLDVDPADFTGPLDLTFEFDTTEVTVNAELREIGDAMEGMDSDEMEDGSMDEMEDDDSMEEMEDS